MGRDELIDEFEDTFDEIIEPAGHGLVRFTIPYTAEHLREHAAHDALEGLGDDR